MIREDGRPRESVVALKLESNALPLQMTSQGVVRVGGTRVTLDTVIRAFRAGATAEQIVLRYPSLDLADAYATIAYYLRNRDEVDGYLERRSRDADRVRRDAEARFDPKGIRDRLLARRGRSRPSARHRAR